MRWRLGPRTAFALGLLCASMAGMRFLRPADVTSAGLKPSPVIQAGLKPTPYIEAATTSGIDGTLRADLAGCAGARSTVWNPLAGVDYTGRIRIDLPARSGGAI